MNVSFNDLHKAFENRIRLGIMSVLTVNESLDFNAMKEYLEVTDGNLSTHIKKLEGDGFVDVKKSFIDNKPNTKYSITSKGREAFEKHLKAMEQIIKAQQ